MCGIAGIYGGEIREEMLKIMMESLKHRGPDSHGILKIAGAGLAHTRLSILDLSESGNQPMQSADGRYVLIHNGEIYNYLELREKLKKFNIQYKGKSDTETLLHLLIHFGKEILQELNGIFAFAFYDTESNILLLARDEFGVKPLYYTENKGVFYFASEIKALISDASIATPILNKTDLTEFFMFHFIAGEKTLFKNIYQVLPGHFIELTEKGKKGGKFIDFIPKKKSFIQDEKSIIEEIALLLGNAVKRQKMSDVPVGIMLSGGLDSAGVAVFSKEYKKNGYCFLDDEKGYNEFDSAEKIAIANNIQLIPVRISEAEIPSKLQKATLYYDEPLPRPHHLAAFEIARQASSDGVKVLLTGEGSDELFGGYGRYIEMQEAYKRDADEEHFLFGNNRVALPAIQKFLQPLQFNTGFRHALNKSTRGYDSINRQLYYDQFTFLSHFLQRSDRMGMAWGLENRVPFLDKELCTFINSLDGSLKIKNKELKHLLRAAMGNYLPPEIISRPKEPFEMPIAGYMVRGRLKEMIDDFLLTNPRCSAILNKSGIESAIQAMQAESEKPKNAWKMVWLLLGFEIWMRTFNIHID